MAKQKNNLTLVDYAIRSLGTGYVYGTFGQILTENLLDWKARQYPSQVGSKRDFIKRKWLNKPVQDCIGLIKGHLWTADDGVMKYLMDGIPDLSANKMFNVATEKGPIATMPEIQGLLVWKPGHIGVYIGNGRVVEAHGTTSGVIKTRFTGSINETKWTHWLKCPFIRYEDETVVSTSDRTYTVQRSDSLWSIAVKLLGNGSRYKEIAALNNIRPPYVIHQNQVLKVPKM